MTLKFRDTSRIEWGDCDPLGIMFYPNCFRWFDTATHKLFDAAGRSMASLVEKYGIVGCPLVDVGATFKSPLPWLTEIAVESRVTEWRNSSFIVGHTVFKGDVVAIEGREVRVCVARDGEKLRGVPVPEDLKARFA